MNNFTNRIALGTVQFGLNYGINNKVGMPTEDKIAELLQFAYSQGINTLDTAYAYGKSEERLGTFLKRNKFNFKIISKAPKNSSSENLSRYFEESLAKLKCDYIYGYLLHDFNDFLNDRIILKSMLKLKENGKVNKIGFSLYYPEQLLELLRKNIYFDLIQFPYNLADRRFEPFMEKLKEKSVEIHIRSVFLQGLFFMNVDELPYKLKPFKDFLNMLNTIKKVINKSIENICLNFVIQNKLIDKIILGVDTIEQLKNNINVLHNGLNEDEINLINSEIRKSLIPNKLLIPLKWN